LDWQTIFKLAAAGAPAGAFDNLTVADVCVAIFIVCASALIRPKAKRTNTARPTRLLDLMAVSP
jgi:hypothetical protein